MALKRKDNNIDYVSMTANSNVYYISKEPEICKSLYNLPNCYLTFEEAYTEMHRDQLKKRVRIFRAEKNRERFFNRAGIIGNE